MPGRDSRRVTLPADPVERAIACAALATGLDSPGDVTIGRSKRRARAKQIAVRVLLERCRFSRREIARRLGYYDHSSIIHAVYATDPDDPTWREQMVNALLLYDGKKPLRRSPTTGDVRVMVDNLWGGRFGRREMEAFLCRELLGMSYPEMGKHLQCSHTSAMDMVVRARRFAKVDDGFRDATNRAKARLRALAW